MRKGTDRKKEILAAALARFARFGFRKTTLGEVAADVGLVQSALYKYFASKTALFNSVIDDFGERAMAAVEAAESNEKTVEQKLGRMLRDGYEEVVDSAERYHVSIEAWNEMRPQLMERSAHHKRTLIDHVTRVLERGIVDERLVCKDPLVVAEVIHLMSDNLYERTLLGEITRAEGLSYIDSMVHTLMHGLKHRITGN